MMSASRVHKEGALVGREMCGPREQAHGEVVPINTKMEEKMIPR